MIGQAVADPVRVVKRKAEEPPEGEEHRCEEVIIEECQVDRWVCEITKRVKEETECSSTAKNMVLQCRGTIAENVIAEIGWDDVNGGELKEEDTRKARSEEVGYMEGRKIWSVKPVGDCWEKLGKAPVSIRWVDTLLEAGWLPEMPKAPITTGMICLQRRRREKAKDCY